MKYVGLCTFQNTTQYTVNNGTKSSKYPYKE